MYLLDRLTREIISEVSLEWLEEHLDKLLDGTFDDLGIEVSCDPW